jgi:hypothetical protein
MWGHTAALAVVPTRQPANAARSRARRADSSAIVRSRSPTRCCIRVRTWMHGVWPARRRATISRISVRRNPSRRARVTNASSGITSSSNTRYPAGVRDAGVRIPAASYTRSALRVTPLRVITSPISRPARATTLILDLAPGGRVKGPIFAGGKALSCPRRPAQPNSGESVRPDQPPDPATPAGTSSEQPTTTTESVGLRAHLQW